MKRILLAAGTAILLSSRVSADSVKLAVGHMCCGTCKATATEGVKNVPWADNVQIDGTSLTVNAKEGQKIELISLIQSLEKAGFPPTEISSTGPVTVTVAHMCCGGCVADLKAKVADFRGRTLDKDNVKIDQAARTVVFQPAAGQTLNVVPLLRQLENAGFAPQTCSLATATAASPKPRTADQTARR